MASQKVTMGDLMRLRQVMQKHKKKESIDLALQRLDMEIMSEHAHTAEDKEESPQPLLQSHSDKSDDEDNSCLIPTNGYDCFKMKGSHFAAMMKYEASKQ